MCESNKKDEFEKMQKHEITINSAKEYKISKKT